MSTLATRLLSDGTLLAPTGYFDEITYTTNKITPTAIYSAEFDEVTLNKPPLSLVQKKETNDGKLLVRGSFDEFSYKNFEWVVSPPLSTFL